METIDARTAQNLDHHLDDFGVHHRGFRSDCLRADLVELPEAAFLRALATEHRADIVILLDAGNLI